MKKLSNYILACLLLFPLFANAGTIAYWKLEDSAVDETGNHNATAYGGEYSSFVPEGAGINASFKLDGSDDYVSGGYQVMPYQGNFTVEGWFYLADSASRGGVFQRKEGTPYNGMSLGKGNPSDWGMSVRDKYGNGIWAHTSQIIGEWVHWAGVFDAAEKSVKLYKNGVLVSTDTNSNFTGEFDPSSQEELRIGRRSVTYFNGYIAHVRISDTALTANELLLTVSPVPEINSILLLILGFSLILITKNNWRLYSFIFRL